MPETATHVGSGKVRELYELDDDRLLLVASDRISTFDVVLPTESPDKGRVLTGLSAFWFARTSELVPNHLLQLRADGRSMECRRLDMLPIECVVRGYLTGSGWKDYLASGEVCGHRLAEGLVESGLARGDAYRLVQRHALRAHEEEQDFCELVRADDEIA
ncbi:MAG: phosphoribosylaminoimidazolesuccinocarboxamide synthase, partial [Gaiellaceae bacterium]